MSTQSQNIVATLKRFVRRISAQQGHVATSAFSLAMLVFLVQKAQAASIADTPLDVAPTEKSGLEQVRHTFGNAAQDSVAGIDYSAIVDALADIHQMDDDSLSAEQVTADGVMQAELGSNVQALDAELELIGRYVQDAVQYAQASPAPVAAEGTQAGGTQAPIGSTVEPGGSPTLAAPGLAGLSDVFPFLLGGLALAAAGGGSSTSEPVVTPKGIELTEVKGAVVNGYVAGATVFQDLNGNNKWDEGEPKTTTGLDGSFTLKEQLDSSAPIVISGGTDISTGLAYSNILKGPPGAIVITPLTTLVSALMASGKSQADAEAAVLKAFDLPAGTKLLEFDPVAKAEGADTQALAVKIKAAGVLVANLMDSGGSALAGATGGDGGDASALSYNIAQTIATKISALTTGQPLDLGDTATLESILTDSATSAKLSTEQASKFNAISESAANAIATVNGTIQAAATDSTKSVAEKFNEFSKAQTVAQGTLSDQIKSAADAGTPSTIPDKATIEISVKAVTPEDAAVIGAPTVAAVTEDTALTSGNLIATGSISISDANTGQASFNTTATSADGNLGSLVLAADGSYTYTVANSTVQYLGAGETKTETFTVKSADGTSKTVSFTITGTNDAAVISGDASKSLTETDAILSTSGSLSATDADSATTFVAQTGAAGSGGYGKFSIDASGAWTYTASTAHNEFVSGTVYTDTLTVATADGTSQVITVKITGTNDAAVITGDTSKILTETNAVLTTGGTLSVTDVDSAESFVAQTDAAGSGGYGTFSIGTTGAWTYTASTAHNEFVSGTVYTDTLTVATADGTSQVITVKITGTNDAAVISGDTAKSLTQSDEVLTTSGSLSATDVDSATTFVAQTGAAGSGGYGKFSIDASGAWTYTASTAHNEFVSGTVYTDTLTVATADGTSQVITVKITGTNDAAVIGVPTVAAVTEDTNASDSGNLIATGSISITDADTGQASFSTIVTSAQGNLGSLVLASGGSYTYTVANSAVQYLGAGDTKTETFTVTSADGTSKTVSFTINGSNDAAVIGAPTVAALTEDTNANDSGKLSATGSISITDADTGQASFSTIVTSAQGNLGSLVLASGGSYTYTVANSAVQYLGAGDTKTETFTVTSADGTSKTVSFTINGSNDAPTVAAALTIAATEAAISNVTLDLLGGASDLDTTDSLSLSGVTTYKVGDADASATVPTGLSLSSAGVLTVNSSSSAFNYLAADETLDIVVSYTISDGKGGTVAQTATITVTGTDDAPVLRISNSTRTIDEDQNNSGRTIAFNGSVNDLNVAPGTAIDTQHLSLSDVDTADFGGHTLKVSVTSGNMGQLRLGVSGSNGVFSVDSNGYVHYYSDATYHGDTGNSVTPHDYRNTAADIVIGRFDGTHKGLLGDSLWIRLTENATTEITQALASRIFLGVRNADQTSTQDWSAAAGTKTVTFEIVDGGGNVLASGNRTVNIVSQNDAPTAAGALSSAASEGEASYTLNLLGGARDVDTGDSLSVGDVSYKVGTATASSTVPPGLTLSDAGVLTVDPSNAAFNSLAAGQTQSITVSYKISDGHGGTVDQTAAITITGKSQTVNITVLEAGKLSTDRTYYSADDVVTLNINASDVLGDRIEAITNLKTLGVDFVDIGGDGKFHITAEEADAFGDANIAFVDDDTISLDLTPAELFDADDSSQGAGSYLNGSLAAAVSGATGLGLADLHTLGVDFIDIGGSDVDAKLHIRADDAKAMDAASLAFATADTITLDLTPAELFGADDSSQSAGSYLNGSLAAAVSGATGLGLADLHTLGVDFIDIGGSDVNAKLHIRADDAKAMDAASLAFATADTITLDLTPAELFGADDSSQSAGSYLNGSLAAAVSGATGLGLADLHTLGVDFIDIGGSDVNAKLHIRADDAKAMDAASLAFATADTITLDLTPAELFSADDSSQGAGSYLNGSLAAAVSGATGLGLADLHTLGVDLIDIGGIDVTAKLHISTNDAKAVHNNDLGFASNDQIVLDINPESINSDESASGSYLNGTLDDAIYSSTGLHLTDLQKLGVDLIDIGGSDTAATLHISAADAKAMKDAGLHFATADHISTDGADYSTPDAKASAATAAAVKPASMLGDSLSLQALGAEHVVVDSGVMVTLNQETKFALSADHSLNDLLIALGDSGIVSGVLSDSQDFVTSVAVGADTGIAINDSMVKALLDAGMLSVDKASTIEVDTDSEHMSTSLLQLVDIGTDKVVTSQDKAYADLGDVSDLGQLSNLLSSLLEDSADTNLSTLFVHQTDGESVQEVGLVLTADQVGLATEIEGNTSLLAQLTHVGITELLVATDDGGKGDVQLLGHEYHKQPIA